MTSIKNLVIFGAHGKVGQQLVQLVASTACHIHVTAIVRNDEQAATIKGFSKENNIDTQEFNLESASVDEIADVIRRSDAVVFSVGSRGQNLMQVDLDAAVRTFEASVLAQVRRVIVVSAIHADKREFIRKSPILNYYLAKHYADRILINEFSEKLDFTILKPTKLTDEPASGKIRLIKSMDEPTGEVSRANVAKVIYEVLDNTNTFGKSYDFADGELEITSTATFV